MALNIYIYLYSFFTAVGSNQKNFLYENLGKIDYHNYTKR